MFHYLQFVLSVLQILRWSCCPSLFSSIKLYRSNIFLHRSNLIQRTCSKFKFIHTLYSLISPSLNQNSLILQVRRLRIQQRIKSAELGIIDEEQENELPNFPSFLPFLPPLVSFLELLSYESSQFFCIYNKSR